jgi:hypothetical protein
VLIPARKAALWRVQWQSLTSAKFERGSALGWQSDRFAGYHRRLRILFNTHHGYPAYRAITETESSTNRKRNSSHGWPISNRGSDYTFSSPRRSLYHCRHSNPFDGCRLADHKKTGFACGFLVGRIAGRFSLTPLGCNTCRLSHGSHIHDYAIFYAYDCSRLADLLLQTPFYLQLKVIFAHRRPSEVRAELLVRSQDLGHNAQLTLTAEKQLKLAFRHNG